MAWVNPICCGGPAAALSAQREGFVVMKRPTPAWRNRVEKHLAEVLAKNTEFSPDDIHNLVDEGVLTLVGISRHGAPAGFGLVQLHGTPAGRWLHDAHVWIFPEHRRQGLYSAYIAYLKRWAAREGWLGVKCLVHADEDEEIWQKTLPALGGQRRTVEYVLPVEKKEG